MNEVAAVLLAELKNHAVEVERHGDRLRMRAPQAPPDDLLDRVSANKPALLAALPDVDARPVVHFRLPDNAMNTVATYLGRPGQSRESVTSSLLERWPDAVVYGVDAFHARAIR